MSNPTFQPNPGQKAPGSIPKQPIIELADQQLEFDFESIKITKDIPIPDDRFEKAQQIMDSMEIGHSFAFPESMEDFFNRVAISLRPKVFVSGQDAENETFIRCWRKA